MQAKPSVKVGVVSPFYNSAHHTKGWLSRLALQNYPYFKLYLVDDASRDGTAESLTKFAYEFKLPFEVLSQPHNVGPSKARNIAITKALAEDCDLILLLDADCRVDADWIKRHVETHEALSDVGIVGGAIQGLATSFIGKADGYCSWFTAVPYSRSGAMKHLHLSSTNMSIKKQVFKTVGMFDERLATGEDVAFCRKAVASGVLIWKQSDIVITHLDREYFTEAKRHHYRWGLHSYPLALQTHGGYYDFLRRIKKPWVVKALVPVFALLNTALILHKNWLRKPQVLFYIPGIFLLKWWNARGVLDGWINPKRAIRTY